MKPAPLLWVRDETSQLPIRRERRFSRPGIRPGTMTGFRNRPPQSSPTRKHTSTGTADPRSAVSNLQIVWLDPGKYCYL